MTVGILVKKMRDSARMPSYQTEGAAGFDLYADLDEEITLNPWKRALIPTGIAIQIEERGLCAMCYARSGLAVKDGITLSNGVGVIDSDYRGEIKVGLVNLSQKPYTIHPGDRIAQVVITPVARGIFKEEKELCETERSGGGFGSTGR